MRRRDTERASSAVWLVLTGLLVLAVVLSVSGWVGGGL